jgi:hypothetical protein
MFSKSSYELLRWQAAVSLLVDPLCHDEEWIKLITSYTVDSSNVIKDVQEIPFYLRPLISPDLSSIRRAAAYRRKVAEKLKPQLNEMI